MKKSAVTCGAVVALLLILGVGSSRAQNCQDLLDNKLYRCQFKDEDGVTGEFCLQAVSPGGIGSKFDLEFGGVFSTTHECTCKGSDKFSDPEFNTSRGFLCGNQEFGDAATGQVKGGGNKINNGQYFFNSDTDVSFVFECQQDAGCS